MNREYQFPFSKYPAVRIVLLLILGILLGWAFSGGIYLPLGVNIVLLGAMIGARSSDRASFSWVYTWVIRAGYILLIIAFGWIRMEMQQVKEYPATVNLMEVSPWEEIEAEGIISFLATNAEGKPRADLHIEKTRFSGNVQSEEAYKARVLFEESIPVSNGDRIFFKGTVIPVSEPRNPGQFDYYQYLADRDIYVQIRLDSLIDYSTNQSLMSWSWWQNQALMLVEQNFNETTAPIAKALLLGYKQDLEGATRQAFARAGLSHIMAVSGLHVGFIVAPFWMIIPLFWRSKRTTIIGFVLLVSLLYFYAGLTGFTSSVIRASVTAVFLTAGKLFNKSSNSINLTASAAILMLLINPEDLFDIGFQLSFSAVFSILLVLPTIQYWLPGWVQYRWYATPLMVVTVSVVVQLGLYPLQVYYFGEASLISPLANALFIPFLGIIVPLSLVCLVISAVIPEVGFWLNIPSFLFVETMYGFVMTAASWDWAWVKASLNSNLVFPIWVAGLLGIASWRVPEIRWKISAIFVGLLCVLSIQNVIQQTQKPEFSVLVFDVGQGDASLLQTPNGKTVLIDAGVWRPGYNSGESIILPYLEKQGIQQLDAVILSHPHADHIGGILTLIEQMEIGMIYNSGYEYDSNLYRNYLLKAEKNQVPVYGVRAGDVLDIDPSVLFL
ncbi:MAG: DNA internalization-related competence protein ComEC/Rec2, partial [Balneolales bacterium]|nr:DNA internalization-related competence protein ComEC/Rec2 [Balneolales bacterium]